MHRHKPTKWQTVKDILWFIFYVIPMGLLYAVPVNIYYRIKNKFFKDI